MKWRWIDFDLDLLKECSRKRMLKNGLTCCQPVTFVQCKVISVEGSLDSRPSVRFEAEGGFIVGTESVVEVRK